MVLGWRERQRDLWHMSLIMGERKVPYGVVAEKVAYMFEKRPATTHLGTP